MVRLIIVIFFLLSGCVATTRMMVRQEVPHGNLSYEVSREITRVW